MGILAEAVIAAFDSNTNLLWSTEGTAKVTARFEGPAWQVQTTFTATDEQVWRVSFEVRSDQRLSTETASSSIRIFSGVFQAVREFLEVRQPEKLVFASKDEALGGLYETYLMRQDTLLKQMGYSMIPPVKASPFTEFAMEKKTPSQWRS